MADGITKQELDEELVALIEETAERAEEAFQLGNERKQNLVDALIAKGVSASMADSWDVLFSKIVTANPNISYVTDTTSSYIIAPASSSIAVPLGNNIKFTTRIAIGLGIYHNFVRPDNGLADSGWITYYWSGSTVLINNSNNATYQVNYSNRGGVRY